MISAWWAHWNLVHLERDEITNDGFICVYALHDGAHIPAAAAFCYLPSNSRVCQVGFPVACPSVMFNARERAKALNEAILSCRNLCIGLGYKRIMALSNKTGISSVYKRQGFHAINEPHDFLVYAITEP